MKNTINYKAWKIKEEDFPKSGTMVDKVKFFVEYGILAPSTHNSQPWKFKIAKDALFILPDWKFKLPHGDPQNHYLYFSLGCLVSNIIHTANHFGFTVKTIFKNNPDIPIQLIFSKSSTPFKSNNFQSITSRFTDKFFYQNKQIPLTLITKLKKIKQNDGIKLLIVNNNETLSKIALIHRNAILSFLQNKQFKNELSGWMRTNNTDEFDGMPGFISGMSSLKVTVGKFLLRNTPIVIKGHAKKDSLLISTSPAVGLITTSKDSMIDWIKSGILYEDTALAAKKENINCAILTAMLEDKKSQNDLKKLLDIRNNIQIFFRLGSSGKSNIHTPRRVPQYV